MEKTIKSLTKDERNLLLYFETLAVDHEGVVDSRKVNAEDVAIAKKWTEEGFVKLERFTKRSFSGGIIQLTHRVLLSDNAWTLAHAERRARAKRTREE